MAWTVAGQNLLLERKGYSLRYALNIFALEQVTLVPATASLWSGGSNRTMTLDGTSRTYLGGLGGFYADDFVYAKGLEVRTLDVRLSAVSDVVQDVVRGRVIEFVDAALYAVLFDPSSNTIVSWNRMFKGMVNSASIDYPAMNAAPVANIQLVSSLRKLTRTLAVKKSDESQKVVSGDRFRKYGAVANTVVTRWVKD